MIIYFWKQNKPIKTAPIVPIMIKKLDFH